VPTDGLARRAQTDQDQRNTSARRGAQPAEHLDQAQGQKARATVRVHVQVAADPETSRTAALSVTERAPGHGGALVSRPARALYNG
jgi:hypothetical protein